MVSPRVVDVQLIVSAPALAVVQRHLPTLDRASSRHRSTSHTGSQFEESFHVAATCSKFSISGCAKVGSSGARTRESFAGLSRSKIHGKNQILPKRLAGRFFICNVGSSMPLLRGKVGRRLESELKEGLGTIRGHYGATRSLLAGLGSLSGSSGKIRPMASWAHRLFRWSSSGGERGF